MKVTTMTKIPIVFSVVMLVMVMHNAEDPAMAVHRNLTFRN